MPVISVTVAHKKETWVVFLGTSLSRKYAINFECSRMDSEKPCPDMAKEVEKHCQTSDHFFLEFRWGKVNTQANGHPVLHPASQTCPWHSPWDQLRLHRPWLVRASEVWGALGNGRWGPRVLCYSRCESRTNVPAFPGSLWKMQTLLPHLGHFVPESAFYQDPQWFLYTLWFEKHWYRMLLCSICS